MKRALRRAVVAALVVTFAVTGSAYLANNVVSPSQAGEGHGGVTVTVTSGTGQPIVDAPAFPVT